MRGLGLEVVSALTLVGVQDLAETMEDLLHVVGPIRIGRHFCHGELKFLQLVMQLAQVAAAGNGFVQNRSAGHLADILPEVTDGGALGNRDRAFVAPLFARDQPEDGGLSGSVGADQAHLLTGVELKGRLHEKDLATIALGDVGQVDHGMDNLLKTLNVSPRTSCSAWRRRCGPRRSTWGRPGC